MERILEYSHKSKILRQIQSNKSKKYRIINNVQNILTVIISSFITFIGFSGIEKITKYFNWFFTIEQEKVEFIFNLLVFFLLVQIIFYLIFQYSKKQSEADRAIITLTALINEIDDILDKILLDSSSSMTIRTEIIRQKYETIAQVIPSNSDKEFLRAKKDYERKEIQKSKYENIWKEIFEKEKQKGLLVALIRNSDSVMRILTSLRNINENLYLGGGLVRNLVWDYLHQYKQSTPMEDIDIIYFNNLDLNKSSDLKIEEQLKKEIPNYKWSVKNQARMHIYNNEEKYSSLEEAIYKWPETCTAFVLRLNKDEQIEFISPFGFIDLFRLIVYPTPHFLKKIDNYIVRINKKNWESYWPKLRVFTFNNNI